MTYGQNRAAAIVIHELQRIYPEILTGYSVSPKVIDLATSGFQQKICLKSTFLAPQEHIWAMIGS